ncbi:MAG: DMT family transporter [Lachnospiraceae bacterium]|nr:DMT family transporter [Lachnospiraceae bacterium]
MSLNKTRANLMLALAALIWGAAFSAQSIGMDYVGPFTFNSVRSFVGGIALVIYISFTDRKKPKPKSEVYTKSLLTGGIACGIVLAVASSLQQHGIMFTTVGKAGFITALYIVIVPILGIFLKKKVSPVIWLSVLLAVFGMYLLCMTESLVIEKGDFYVLVCAFFFAVHILVIDHFSPKADCVRMSCIQFFVCGIICLVPAAMFEHPSLGSILDAWLPILYAGAFSCGIAYTLQIAAQRHTNVVIASLILSLESVFSVLFGWILLSETLSAREILGCIVVFAAILLTNVPDYIENRKRKASCLK